jgi:hypothetical protein
VPQAKPNKSRVRSLRTYKEALHSDVRYVEKVGKGIRTGLNAITQIIRHYVPAGRRWSWR